MDGQIEGEIYIDKIQIIDRCIDRCKERWIDRQKDRYIYIK